MVPSIWRFIKSNKIPSSTGPKLVTEPPAYFTDGSCIFLLTSSVQILTHYLIPLPLIFSPVVICHTPAFSPSFPSVRVLGSISLTKVKHTPAMSNRKFWFCYVFILKSSLSFEVNFLKV